MGREKEKKREIRLEQLLIIMEVKAPELQDSRLKRLV
jgi:hypothetical protein